MFYLVIDMNDEMFRLSLIDMMNSDLLNDFVNKFFNYHLKDGEYIYMQYKIVNSNIVLNIYDKRSINKFKAFVFTNEEFDNNTEINYININDCYREYRNNKKKKIYLLGALLKSNSNEEKIKIINYIDNTGIKNILLKHFTI